MRELKFRAFLKANKLIYKVLTLDIQEKKTLIEHGDMRGYVKYPQECELLAYTGFRDSEGREIYEGDILKIGFLFKGTPFDENDDYEEEICVVKFCDKSKTFIVSGKNEDIPLYEVLKSCESCEVLGNIYENEDLLKE